MKTIFCLFSILNEYDQPNNNLVLWFSEKPSIEKLIEHIKPLNNATMEDKNKYLVDIVKLWQGESVRFGNSDYRIEEVKEAE